MVAAAVTVAALPALAGVVWIRAGNSAGVEVPRFVDETTASGLDHRYEGPFEHFVGGGVAAFDCDDDGRPELYLAGGSAPAALYRNTSEVGGALSFEALPSAVTDLTSVAGAYPLDVDSDGIVDLAVLRSTAGNRVLRGLGGCRFEDVTEQLGIEPGSAQTVAFSATWEGSNQLPTLAFGNYLVPGTYDCDASHLVRPDPSGVRYAEPVMLAPGHCALSILFSDWSRSGRADLRMANDRHYYRVGSEQLWRVEHGQEPRLYTEADGWRPLQLFGMGLASRDLTGDGYPEVVITNQGDNKLQTLEQPGTRPAYRDLALELGALAQRPYTGGDVLPSTAWHPELDDVNNDGNVDLFISKGNVSAQPDFARRDPSNLLLRTDDGTFQEAGEEAGIVTFDRGRGAVVTDLNLDGLLDLVLVNREVEARVWRNAGRGTAEQPEPMGHWLGVRLRQAAPNVDAVGAWLEVKASDEVTTHEVTVGGGHAGGELGWIHTGLGDQASAKVRVTWPDGEVGPWVSVDADQVVVIERGATAPGRWPPGG